MTRRGNEANAQPVPAQESYDQDPKAPAGLGPKASPDQRFELCYGPPVAEGVRVLTEYFVALSARDPKAMAETMHFPFGSYEGTEVVVVEAPDDLVGKAPPSMNMSEHPDRFTDHDSFLKPGAYDVFDGIEVLNTNPVAANLSLSYDRYDKDGKRLLRCDGVYCVTNNDGRWAIQLASTIFTPSDMVRRTYPDTVEIAKRLRINHDLAFQVRDDQGVWARVRQHGKSAGIAGGGGWANAPNGNVMLNYRVKGVKNRLRINEYTPESLANMHTDFARTLREVAGAGVGYWGFPIGILPDTRVIHSTVDKAHMYSGVTRFNVQGEEISVSAEISIITYKKGRWGWDGSLAYTIPHDRANDIHS
ncbi:MAG TPA: hypothetical protein VN788_10105 [Verrucomicrobiae bacterium]|nr:hypothetical protein [Verrucomicrobiae bacterium]